MNMSKTTYEKKLLLACQDISRQIAELAPHPTDEQVLDVLKKQRCGSRMLCDAFWRLDNQPARYANHQVWHPRLRSLRNNPHWGEQMFALFR